MTVNEKLNTNPKNSDAFAWNLQIEVRKCLLCQDAPCSKACPRKIAPDQRIRSLYFQNFYGAAAGLEADPCLDCDAPCAKACVLAKLSPDAPVQIKNLMTSAAQIGVNIAKKTAKDFEPDLSMNLCGVKLENPFMLSSSVVSSSYEMISKAFDLGWAGVSYKTICSFDQHETSPRFSAVKNTPGSFAGFKNIEQLSVHTVADDMATIRKLKKNYPAKVVMTSIMGRNEAEWEALARTCQENGADAIELNFSCPNMEDDELGSAIGQSEKLIEKYTAAARRGCTIPLIAKMTPNITDMVPMALAAKRGGADGISAINTIKSITGVELPSGSPEPNVSGRSALGGYSGAAVKPIALRFISDLCGAKELAPCHISGMGGIENWHSALEFIMLGAGSLQITTAVMQYGYRIIEDLLGGIRGYMLEEGIKSLYALKGSAEKSLVNLDELERDTVLFPAFDRDKCIGCGRCAISCYDGGHQAISFDPATRKPVLNGSRCVGCHLCRLICPANAIGTVSKRVPKKAPAKQQ